MKFASLAPLSAACLALVAGAAVAAPKPHPAITLARATSIAVKAAPGRVVASELEAEKGGSGLRYSFDIRSGSVTREVGVDAATGRVLENAVEGAHPD